jgi:hypothetical protein
MNWYFEAIWENNEANIFRSINGSNNQFGLQMLQDYKESLQDFINRLKQIGQMWMDTGYGFSSLILNENILSISTEVFSGFYDSIIALKDLLTLYIITICLEAHIVSARVQITFVH